MDEAGRVVVLCRECVDNLQIPSTFCSPRCYDFNFQHHRDDVHIPAMKKAERQIDDESLLEFDPDDKTRYRARKIEEHFVTLDDALEEYKESSGATLS